MTVDLDRIITHDQTEECVACHAQELVAQALLPAVAAWEVANQLPQFAVALHGAAGLLGTVLEAGVNRDDLERALSQLLDDEEGRIAEDKALGGPTQGTA